MTGPAEPRGAPSRKRLLAGASGACALALVAVLVAHRLTMTPPSGGGRYARTLPFEMEIADSQISLVGGVLGEVLLDVPRSSGVVVRLLATGQACPPGEEGLGHVELAIDGAVVKTFAIDAPMPEQRVYASGVLPVREGVRAFKLTFVDDFYQHEVCDRNVFVRRWVVEAAPAKTRATAGEQPR
jgi:hypothetical protein